MRSTLDTAADAVRQSLPEVAVVLQVINGLTTLTRLIGLAIRRLRNGRPPADRQIPE